MFKIYSRPNCTYCTQAKALLDRKGLTYTEIELNAENLEEFQKITNNARTVPQVFYYEKLIGGFTELAALADEWWDDIKES